MKTSLEIPDTIFRRAKSVAAERGIPLRKLICDALADKLRADNGSSRPWLAAVGKLRHLRKETARINREFEQIDVLGEYRYGIAHSRNRNNYEPWLVRYLSKFRVLDVDERTTIPYSAIHTELKKTGTQFLPMTFGSPRFAVSTRSRS
jgi:hypothetical protein